MKLVNKRDINISACLILLCTVFPIKVQAAYDFAKDKPVIQQLEKANAEQLAAFIEKNPQSVIGHILLGRYLEAHGYVNLAADQYEQAWALDKTRPDSFMLVLKGRFAQPDKGPAKELIATNIGQFSKDYNVLASIGMLMQEQREYALADRCFEMAQKLNPNIPELTFTRAQNLTVQGKYADAVAEAQKVMKEPRMRYMALGLMARASAADKKYRDAVRYAGEIFVANPYDGDNDELLARCLVSMQAAKGAMVPTLFSLAIDSNDKQKIGRIKYLLMSLLRVVPQDYSDKAISTVGEALKGKDYESSYYFALGDVYDRMGKPLIAMEQYKQGLKIQPYFARGYLRLAEDQETKLHDYNAALKNYAAAYQLKSDDEEIQRRYKRLYMRMKNRHNDLALRLRDWVANDKANNG